MLDSDLPFSKTQAGRARLRVSKDRDGNFSSNSVLAEMHVTLDAGSVSIELRAVVPLDEAAADDAHEALWQRISVLVEVRGSMSSNKLAEVIGSNRPLILDAIKAVEAAGFLVRESAGKPLQSYRPSRASGFASTLPDYPLAYDEAAILAA